MNKVRIITDTVACIPAEWAAKYSISVVPTANIMIDGALRIENKDITTKQAYDLIRKNPDRFITSAITPGQILEVYRQVCKETSEIVFISLSSELSAVYKSASVAADLFKEESPKTTIKILNSKNVASGEALIVLAAARAAAQGLNLNQVLEIAEQAIQQTRVIMMLDTLRYVYRTGRMSKIGSRVASIFNIRPINKLTQEGTLVMVDRVRDRESGLQKMIKLIHEDIGAGEGYQFIITHADVEEYAHHVLDQLNQEFHCGEDVIISDFSPVMGYGSGPGAILIGYRPHVSIAKI